MLNSMNTSEKNAVNITVAVSWYSSRRYCGISLNRPDIFRFKITSKFAICKFFENFN